ncbi:cation/acetate symporter ActP [Pseudomaricurvus alkylphenolicus]|uniref:sodium:solute symporter family transporter n=1 Tax=Pseudomaricurvus alkylphenolicus TaxID=1306991 RepID=UPI001420BA44|nr:cation/acetate symporter ActP [Pseudomaricurvus alkylphenolicus]NIB43497.1 cation/acetate symporter ActP [Pseudomaricurvus alkylphenolicus]
MNAVNRRRLISRSLALWGLIPAAVAPGLAVAAGSVSGSVETQPLNLSAIVIFLMFVVVTLGITYWAASRTRSRSDFYSAGGGIPAWQNGVAISGDFLSAATLLGITSSIYSMGVDGLTIIAGTLGAWPIVLFLIAERLRNLGRFTFIDVVSFRLSAKSIRPVAAVASLFVLVFYLIAQLVGAGKLIQLLFGLDYILAIVSVSLLMVFYVAFGGMLAATWVQFIKAVLLVVGGTLMALLLLNHFDFNMSRIFTRATEIHPMKDGLMEAGAWLKSPGSVLSVGLTLLFGFIGLPHILMRLFTVKDAASSRKSAFYAISIIGYFQLLIILIGFGAVALIMGNDTYHDAQGSMIGGGNMVVLHVTHYLGGDLLLGFIAAVTFATILAVVSGLTISAAATIAHDLYAESIAKGKVSEQSEMLVSKMAVIGMGVIAIVFGIIFEHQNVVFISNLAMAIAASANAPVLLMAMYWKGLTTRGALAGILVGLISSVVFILLGPQVMVDIMGMEAPLFPYAYPTVISVPLAFASLWYFSVTDVSVRGVKEKEAFNEQMVLSETGIGVSEAVSH